MPDAPVPHTAPTAPPDAPPPAPRIAIVHHWLLTMRGGERVLESLVRLFPGAEIFPHVVDRARLSLRDRVIHPRFIARLPKARRLYPRYLPLMPLALEGFDLSGFDIVITNDSGPVKGVLTSAEALHVC